MIGGSVYRIDLVQDGGVVGVLESAVPLPIPSPGEFITIPNNTSNQGESWKRKTFLVAHATRTFHYDADTACTVEIEVEAQW